MRRLVGMALLTAALVGQAPATPDKPPEKAHEKAQEKTLQQAQQAVEAWLGSPMTDEKLEGKAIAAVLDAGDPALVWFGGELGKATDLTDARTKGMQAVATHVCIDFIKRARATDMVFAGQYSPLQPLMPFVGKLYLKLLLQTPDWYPTTYRAQLVPALRDLYADSPGADAVQGMIAIVEDERIEPENLRVQLSMALHQWGRPEYVEPVIERWRKECGDGKPADRVDALRYLADVYYQLRDYKHAAATRRLMEALATSSDVPLWPADYYSSACVHALCGDQERAIAEFERCVERQTDGRVDSSLFLKREVFERDPEIKSLRGTERFEKAMQKAFPPGKPGGDERDGDKHGEGR